MMVHMDGSPYDWLGNGTMYDLVHAYDDANNKLYDIELVREEDAFTRYKTGILSCR